MLLKTTLADPDAGWLPGRSIAVAALPLPVAGGRSIAAIVCQTGKSVSYTPRAYIGILLVYTLFPLFDTLI